MARQTDNKQPIYPLTEWEIVETQFKKETNYRNETVFALGNGYLGIRGTFEEGLISPERIGLEGTYINAFYESEPIRYPEIAFGQAENSQTMLNITNGKVIRLWVEGESFSLLNGEVKSYTRTLQLREGLIERTLVWRSPKGHEVQISVTRLVSFEHKHLMAIRYEVTPLNFSGSILLEAALDGDVTNLVADNDPRAGSGLQGRVLHVEAHQSENGSALLVQRTENTQFQLVVTMDTVLTTNNPYSLESIDEDLTVSAVYNVTAQQGQMIRLEKYVGYVTSRDPVATNLVEYAWEVVRKGKQSGFEAIQQSQHDFMTRFWDRADVEIKGDPALQQGIRFNLYHLLQSVGRDGRTNIAAKGLTGEGYEGHYFWDTETYVLPFFLFNSPAISRSLLEYRYGILDKARERARQMAHNKGALFPWRTINGEECSAYFPAGTAQYHIDADIALAIKRYVQATNDDLFLVESGAEILFETARLWANLGAFIPHKGNKFCISGVTGPDEYTALVDNNCYTNLMAQENLDYACQVAEKLKTTMPEAYEQIAQKINLRDEELAFWRKAADEMYIPYDEALGIYKQDDSFLDLPPWDFANTPPDKYPLLIHYHPLVIYRHQVCKQADLILAMFLLSHKFTLEEKRRNYDFYEPLTTHDSSLSTCIFSIVANDIGYYDKAFQYFAGTARMDLDDTHNNVKDGVHIANMAGTWMSLVNGFAGMRAYDDVLSFKPYLPAAWEGYSFKVTIRGRVLKITVDRSGTTYDLLEGDTLTITHNGNEITLSGDAPQAKG